MISVELEHDIPPASTRRNVPGKCIENRKPLEICPIVAASTNIALLTTVHDLVRRERGTLIAVLSYERFVGLLDQSVLRGTICIDFAAPAQVRQTVLRLLPTLNKLATLMWIGTSTSLSVPEQAVFQTEAALKFTFPADAVAFRHAICRLNLPGR